VKQSGPKGGRGALGLQLGRKSGLWVGLWIAYKMGVRPFSFISNIHFSLFTSLFPQTLCSLSILLLSSPIGEWEERRRLAGQGWSETAPTRRLAVVDGGAAAPNAFFFSAYSLLLFFLKLFLNSKTPNTNPIFLDLQKNKTKEERHYL